MQLVEGTQPGGMLPGCAVRAAVLGHPIAHSKSPLLHGAAYAYLGLDWGYGRIDVTAEQLPAFMAGVRTDPGWRGLSVTMPLKHAMAALVDDLTPVARALGVVNTVTFDYGPGSGNGPDGGASNVGASDGARPEGAGDRSRNPSGVRLTGHNTDVAGIVHALQHAGVAAAPSAAILGGGGTAASALAALTRLGAPAVQIYLRNPDRGAGLLELAQALGQACELLPLDGALSALAARDVVVSTLPPGAADPVAEQLAALAPDRAGAVLLDVAYEPWPSRLATAWEASAGASVHGLEMLLYQAVEQVRLFTGPAFRDEPGVINVMCDAVDVPRR